MTNHRMIRSKLKLYVWVLLNLSVRVSTQNLVNKYNNIDTLVAVSSPLTGWIKMWSWWRHQMEAFSALLALFAGNSPVTGEFPSQRPMTRSFDMFFYLRLNKRLSKQSLGRWFEMPLCSLWRHCNVLEITGSCRIHLAKLHLVWKGSEI